MQYLKEQCYSDIITVPQTTVLLYTHSISSILSSAQFSVCLFNTSLPVFDVSGKHSFCMLPWDLLSSHNFKLNFTEQSMRGKNQSLSLPHCTHTHTQNHSNTHHPLYSSAMFILFNQLKFVTPNATVIPYAQKNMKCHIRKHTH